MKEYITIVYLFIYKQMCCVQTATWPYETWIAWFQCLKRFGYGTMSWNCVLYGIACYGSGVNGIWVEWLCTWVFKWIDLNFQKMEHRFTCITWDFLVEETVLGFWVKSKYWCFKKKKIDIIIYEWFSNMNSFYMHLMDLRNYQISLSLFKHH